MADFRMPSLGADMDAGTIVEWKVRPGDAVHRGDVVAVVDTDKADIDAEIFEDGVIGELLVQVGEKVPVGTVLATVVPAGAGAGTPASAPAPVTAAPVTAASVTPSPTIAPVVVPVPASPAVAPLPVPAARVEPAAHAPVVRSPVVRRLAARRGVDLRSIHGTGVGGTVTRADVEAATRPTATRPRVSPRARRLAVAAGVELTELRGSGPGGAVTGGDVEAAARTGGPEPAATPAAAASDEARPSRATTMQQRIAALMERANREIPQYWVRRDLDFGTSADWLAAHNEPLPPAERIVPAALLLTATARAAATVPDFNGWWVDGELRPSPTVELGIIIVLRTGGLLVPVIHDAASLTATEVMRAMADLVRRARSGHLRSSEMSDPTISVSNLGDQGADEVLGVIYPPQVALVGFGRVREQPWAEGGMVGVRPVVTASLAGDHRASDGHQASRFLAVVDQLLHSPDTLEEVQR